MKILLISPLCPLPLEKGGAVRVWNIAKELSKSHQVDLLCFIRSEKEWRYEADLKQVFRNVHMMLRREIVSPRVLLDSGWKKMRFFQKNFKLVVQSLFSMRPLLSLLYEHDDLVRYVKLADDEREYDLIYLETYYVGASLRDEFCTLKTPLLLCEQNVEYEAYGRQAQQQKNHLLRLLMNIDVWKMKLEEILYWKRVPKLSGLSQVDVREMKEASDREDVFTIENGVDVAWFSQELVERVNNEVLFVGSFAYFPNVEALKWLVDDIWPSINDRLENPITLRIVGRGADDDLKAYVKSKGLLIDESVEDIREAFQHASVLIAPLRAGSGTKYKILEAMASHCPVVTTRVGSEGLDVHAGHEMMIADTADQLVKSVLMILDDKVKAGALASHGYDFVSSKYDWKEIVGAFARSLEKI